jgi:hypothetical protein
MPRAPYIPAGAWPVLMTTETAAAYMGERSVQAFRRRIGKLYPKPRIVNGRGPIWLKEDLDGVVLLLRGMDKGREDAESLL